MEQKPIKKRECLKILKSKRDCGKSKEYALKVKTTILMAKVFKVVFTSAIPACKVPQGLELNVTTNGSKPNDTEIKKALEAAGYKIGGDTPSGKYKIEG